MNDEPKSMMEQVTNAFLWPWPRKVLGKPTGKSPSKGGKPSASKGPKSKASKPRSGIKQKKGVFGGSWD